MHEIQLATRQTATRESRLIGGGEQQEAGVLEPGMSKIKSFKFATEAAITILRIDTLIKLPKQEAEGSAYQQALADGSLEG